MLLPQELALIGSDGHRFRHSTARGLTSGKHITHAGLGDASAFTIHHVPPKHASAKLS